MLQLITSAEAQETPTEGPAEAQVGAGVTESFAPGEASHGGAEAHGAETGAHGGGHGGFPPFEPSTYGSQLLWLAITFGLLYWLMSKVVLPRIGATLESRDNQVAGDLATAGRLKAETDAAIAAYEQSLAEARNRAHGIAQGARDESKAAVEVERKSLERDLNERLEAAEARIADVKSQALGHVDGIARDATAALVETLLGFGAPPDEIAAAVRSSLNERSPA